MTAQLNKKSNSFLLLLLLGVIWGTGYSLARFAMTHGVPPLGYSFWQALGPAVVISFILQIKRDRLTLSLPHIRYYLICGLTGIVIPNTNMYFSAPHLPAGLLAVIVNIVPVITYPLALLLRVEAFHRTRLIGVLLAVAGLMCLFLPKTGLSSTNMSPWILSSLITPCSFAFCAVYIARYRPAHTNSINLAAGTLIAGSLLLIPIVAIHHDIYLFHFPFTTADFVILLEIILSSLGYILFFQLIRIAGPVYYSLVDTTVSLTGLWWGYFIFGEKLNHWTLPAVALIILSLFLVTKRQRKEPATHLQ